MPTYDPHYNPIQPDDEAFNRRMAEIEERRRARGTMPTTVVGPTGASPGKDMAGRPLVPPAQAPAQPADPSKPAKTGDAFGDFRAQQQAENRRRIAEGRNQRADAALAAFATQASEEAKAKAELRESQNQKAFVLWRALGSDNEEIRNLAARDFASTYNEQVKDRGSITNFTLEKDKNGNPFFRFTAQMPDGRAFPDGQMVHTFDFDRKKIQDKLMRHGFGAEQFIDQLAKEQPKPEPAKPAMTPEQREKLIGTVLDRYSPEKAPEVLKSYGIEDFDPSWLKPAPVEPPAKPAADAKPEDEYDLYQKFAAETTDAGRDILMRRAQKAGFDTSKWAVSGDGRAPVAPPAQKPVAGEPESRHELANRNALVGGGIGHRKNSLGWIVKDNQSYNHLDLERQFDTAGARVLMPQKFQFMTETDREKTQSYLDGQPFVQFDMKKIEDENTKKMIRSAFPGAVEVGGLLRVREDEFKAAGEWVKEGFGFKEDYDAEVRRKSATKAATTSASAAKKREAEARKRAAEKKKKEEEEQQ